MVGWLIERDGGESWSLREKVKLRHGKIDNSPIRCSIPISISLVDIILSTQDTSESNCVEHVFLEVFVGANAPELARIGRVGHCHRVHEVWNAS